MKRYNCYTCGAFLKVYKIQKEDLKEGQDERFIGSVDLVCKNKMCSDYDKHHVDNLIDEQ